MPTPSGQRTSPRRSGLLSLERIPSKAASNKSLRPSITEEKLAEISSELFSLLLTLVGLEKTQAQESLTSQKQDLTSSLTF
jgi:hypothetical protein